MDRKIKAQIQEAILKADTVEKAWEFFSSLLSDGNGYSDATYLANARVYASVATELYK